MNEQILGGIMGLCVGDALGVPVEFESREMLSKNPVEEMRKPGICHQPPGTWSDDSSMTLCLLDSISSEFDYKYVMDRFLQWLKKSEYTPYGITFGVGRTTREALEKYASGIDALHCGQKSESNNGNGSLMRILPILFYIQSLYGLDFRYEDNTVNIIHNVSALTHAHERSLIACGIYISAAEELSMGKELHEGIMSGIERAFGYYNGKQKFSRELLYYRRIKDLKKFSQLPEYEIKSSGYVVDTLEAALWCLVNTESYRDCVLKAVNLGGDTDTVAAVAGGIAGMYYGYDSIPKEWISLIARRNFIEDLCKREF